MERIEKMCNTCYKIKPVSEFYKKYNSKCKSCHHSPKLALSRKWKEEDPIEYERNKKFRVKAKLYGISVDDIEAQGSLQEWRCGICRKDISYKPFVDHDHETGEFRGLLCHHCNVGIGFFKNSPYLLRQAIMYLQRLNF